MSASSLDWQPPEWRPSSRRTLSLPANASSPRTANFPAQDLPKPARSEAIRPLDRETLQRTFNKKVQHVRVYRDGHPRSVPSDEVLDLEPSLAPRFDPDLLRFEGERFYATVVLGVWRACSEFYRIQTWHDGGYRTTGFLIAYAVIWAWDRVVTALLASLCLLVLVPASRTFLFPDFEEPSAPSPERQAADFVDTVSDVIQRSVLGGLASGPSTTAAGDEDHASKERDKKKKDRIAEDERVLFYLGPVQVFAADWADAWERWANALSPTPPLHAYKQRLRLACLTLFPLLAAAIFVPPQLFNRICWLGLGVYTFCQPVFDWLFPWPPNAQPDDFLTLTEVRSGLLAGVPTDAQLALRILRDAEARLQPLSERSCRPNSPEYGDGLDGLHISSHLSSSPPSAEGGPPKLAAFIRRAATLTEASAGFLSGKRAMDWQRISQRAMSKLHVSEDNKAAQKLLARIPQREDRPSSFLVSHNGRPGHVLIYPPVPSSQTPARIVFTTIGGIRASENLPLDHTSGAKRGNLVISINDIVELRKRNISFAGRLFFRVAGGLEDAGSTGLEIKIRRRHTVKGVERTQQIVKLGAIPRRDELFTRLISLGSQRWENL